MVYMWLNDSSNSADVDAGTYTGQDSTAPGAMYDSALLVGISGSTGSR
jgi:hypothetical protein